MSVPRDKILRFLEETFRISLTPDNSYNGLQFDGKKNIQHLVTGVDASEAFLREAIRRKADLAIVHHGLFWKGNELKKIDRFMKRKLEVMIRGDLNLYGIHLPLDSHPDLGNNAVLARLLGLTDLTPFSEYQGQKIGFWGRFPRPLSRTALVKKITAAIGPLTGRIEFGATSIRTLGIVSGGGGNSVMDPEAQDGRLDALLTGEIIHQIYGVTEERQQNLYAAGHYATERFGVQALGEKLAEVFRLNHEFIDLPTGL